MDNLSGLVRSVVDEFLANHELFTALDVSNKVKETLPTARHRDVREEVRYLYNTVMYNKNYDRTTISVTLVDGTKADALLYHPSEDIFDLDAKYDAKKRAQVSQVAQPAVQMQPAQTVTAPVTTSVSAQASDTQVTVTRQVTVKDVSQVSVPTSIAGSFSARELWEQLFKNQQSLFPRR